MTRGSWKRWLITAVAAGVLLPAVANEVGAGEKWKRFSLQLDRIFRLVFGRKKSMHAFYSDHYGYYPNTWRRWPANWEQWRKRFSAAQGAPIELPAVASDNESGKPNNGTTAPATIPGGVTGQSAVSQQPEKNGPSGKADEKQK